MALKNRSRQRAISRILVVVLLLSVFGTWLQRPEGVAAAGIMTWIDPYCSGSVPASGASDPGVHWWDYWGGTYGDGSVEVWWANLNGVYYRVETGAYKYAYGQDVTLSWNLWAPSGNGTYRTTLAYSVGSSGTMYHTEWIDC